MALDQLWLLIPIVGGIVIIALLVTFMCLCKQKCSNSDKGDEASDIELQEHKDDQSESKSDVDSLTEAALTTIPEPASSASSIANTGSIANIDSIRAKSRKLPDIPRDDQQNSPPTPPPPPDVTVVGGGDTSDMDAGTYAALGDMVGVGGEQGPTQEVSPYAEGKGLNIAANNNHADLETGEPVSRTPKRSELYSLINRELQAKSRKLRDQREAEGIKPDQLL